MRLTGYLFPLQKEGKEPDFYMQISEYEDIYGGMNYIATYTDKNG